MAATGVPTLVMTYWNPVERYGPDRFARDLAAAGVRITTVEDFRPGEAYVTFRCWDPDGTEVEVYWQAP